MIAMTMQKLEDAMKLCEDLKPNDEWMLVSPQNQVWKAKPDILLQVLGQQCPIEAFLKENSDENMGPL